MTERVLKKTGYREGFEKDWFMTVIPEVLPNGIVINKVNQMADDEWVVNGR